MTKPVNLPLIIQNLELAIEAVKAQPETNFDLLRFKQIKPDCGTCFCTLGLLSTMDHFRNQGVVLNAFKQPFNDLTAYFIPCEVDSEGRETFGWLDALFGPDAFKRLFEQAGDGEFDDEHWREAREGWYNSLYSRGMPPEDYPFGYSDKDLALDRLKAQLGEMQDALEKSKKGELPNPPRVVIVK